MVNYVKHKVISPVCKAICLAYWTDNFEWKRTLLFWYANN